LPPILFLKLEKGVLCSPKKIANIGILIFGILAMVGTVGTVIYQQISGN
jgi:hypothetical protein